MIKSLQMPYYRFEVNLLVVLVSFTPLITALRKACWPTFSRCLAITISIFLFSSSILFRRCSSFSLTLFSCDAIASEKKVKVRLA